MPGIACATRWQVASKNGIPQHVLGFPRINTSVRTSKDLETSPTIEVSVCSRSL